MFREWNPLAGGKKYNQRKSSLLARAPKGKIPQDATAEILRGASGREEAQGGREAERVFEVSSGKLVARGSNENSADDSASRSGVSPSNIFA